MAIFKNTKEFASALGDANNIGLSVRPYDRYKSEDTEWWLMSKGATQPAYKFGKIFIEDNKDNKYFCGFCFEKGFSDGIAHEDNEVLTNDWIWHEILKDFESSSNKLEKIFAEVVKNKLIYHINISVGMNNSADVVFDAKIDKSLKLFNGKIDGGSASDRDEFMNRIFEYIQKMYVQDMSVFGVANIINDIPGIELTWVDLKFGVYISKNKNINEYQIWKDYLEPWNDWLR